MLSVATAAEKPLSLVREVLVSAEVAYGTGVARTLAAAYRTLVNSIR